MNEMNGDTSRGLGRQSELKSVENPPGISRTTLAFNDQVMICHFNMSQGSVIPLHDHPAVQAGYVISGRLKFNKGDGTSFVAEPGTGYTFGPNEKHGAEVLEDAEVIESFAPMRSEYADN